MMFEQHSYIAETIDEGDAETAASPSTAA